MSSFKTIAVVGATSTIANHLVCHLCNAGDVKSLKLLGRASERLSALKNDLSVRYQSIDFDVITMDLLDPVEIEHTVMSLFITNNVDLALVCHGDLVPQAISQADSNDNAYTLAVNGASPVLFAEAFARQMENVGRGSICVIGSVAGDIGRKSNYSYGAAKAMVDIYLQGMQHRFADTNITIVLVKPGPTKSRMTNKIENSLKFADPEIVARDIFNGLSKRQRTIYTPRKWFLIMKLLSILPFFIFKRLDI